MSLVNSFIPQPLPFLLGTVHDEAAEAVPTVLVVVSNLPTGTLSSGIQVPSPNWVPPTLPAARPPPQHCSAALPFGIAA